MPRVLFADICIPNRLCQSSLGGVDSTVVDPGQPIDPGADGEDFEWL